MDCCDSLDSPLGRLFVIFSGNSLKGISFDRPRLKTGTAPETITNQLRDYFGGKLREFTLDLRLDEGTEFEKKVWLSLREAPYGQTRTYKWLAELVGRPGGARAVGQALSKNPIPIVLPCHRIIESDGDIGGYSSGVDIKRRLLALEFYNAQER
jgi:methylated-DNA-[protein]-cysteine S-methyltransferase